MNDGRKKKPQKHKNTTAFKITFDTQALQKQKKVSLNNLCVRCTQQMQWKLQYNKYKKMTEPGRCNICMQKNVFRTYMKACQQCAEKQNLCAKCLKADYDQPQEVKVLQKDQKKQQKVEYNKQIDFMKTLQERSRRTVRRGLQKGKISWNNQLEYFVDEEGQKMIGLHFRKGFRDDEEDDIDVMEEGQDDDDMFGDDDQQQQQAPQQKNNKTDTTKQQSKQSQPQQQSKKQDDQQQQQQNQHVSDIQGDELQCDVEVDSEELQEALGKEEDDFEDEQQQEKEEEKKKNLKQKANKKK